MGHKYDVWDIKAPRLDETRADAPEAAKHRSRKDRKRWCRGKVGVEHVLGLRIRKRSEYYQAAWGKSGKDYTACRWTELGSWKPVPHQRAREWVHDGTYRWSCQHDYECENCKRIFGKVGRKCPDFHPHELDWKRV